MGYARSMSERFASSIAGAVLALFVSLGAGCAECENLLDCPAGSICGVDGKCIDECPDGDYFVDLVVTAPDETTEVGGELAIDDGPFVATGPGAVLAATLSSGVHVLRARRGDFTGEITTEICESGRVAIPVRPPPGTVAVVEGVFDTIDRVLENMGFVRGIDFDAIGQVEMTAAGGLDAYRYLFINCGHSLDLSPTLRDQLDAWVEEGGALYTSDQAFNVVAAIWPEQGNGGNVGSAGVFQAEILDQALADHLGKTDVVLDYNLFAWHHIDAIGGNTVELIRGTTGEVAGMSLLLQFERGAGRVTYTTFHNEAQTTEDMDRILSYLVFSL